MKSLTSAILGASVMLNILILQGARESELLSAGKVFPAFFLALSVIVLLVRAAGEYRK
ncbi:hypothetical protein [Paracoccus litorisediminis]|uniref:Uncharacterized protein n=1 Tax=Paracoccus litorisediminis TaxID=2006130 RepID=A0A844HPQ2_9RHOB|nr:hypothetical protein [Paracoccus litorisediminis]MTH61109.1 hypothetical protein [Paracoccus litorisediminis]